MDTSNMSGRWAEVKRLAEITLTDRAVLSVCDRAEKGDRVILRVPPWCDFPSDLWDRMAQACGAQGLTLQRETRWLTVNDLQAVVQEIDWLWENWIPRGLPTMLVGPSGIGKTTVLHHLIKLVVTGGVWPDGSRQEPGSAVFVETESAQALVVKHFREMGIPKDRVYIPEFDGDLLGQVDLLREEHRDLLEQLCSEVRPTLIVIDSIGGSQSRGENQAEEARPIMQYLAMLARDYHCGLVATHHLKKQMAGSENAPLSIDAVRGSTVFVAYTRSLLALSKHKGGLKLEVLKSNLAPISEPFAVKFETNAAGGVCSVRFEPMEPERPERTLVQACAEWLRTALAPKKQTAKTVTEWAAGAGFTRGTLFRAATMLENEGELVRTTSGKTTTWELFRINTSTGQDSTQPGDRNREQSD